MPNNVKYCINKMISIIYNKEEKIIQLLQVRYVHYLCYSYIYDQVEENAVRRIVKSVKILEKP